jgi:hypothetical protein
MVRNILTHKVNFAYLFSKKNKAVKNRVQETLLQHLEDLKDHLKE